MSIGLIAAEGVSLAGDHCAPAVTLATKRQAAARRAACPNSGVLKGVSQLLPSLSHPELLQRVDELFDDIGHIKAFLALCRGILGQRLQVLAHQYVHGLNQPRQCLLEMPAGGSAGVYRYR
jgi:hypothetical protein